MPINRSNVTFWFDDVHSEEIGIKVRGFPIFSAPEPRVTTYSIPGRNGDLVYWDGSFKNTSGEVECFALDTENVDHALSAVSQWLTDCRYKKLVVSSEPGRYRMARVTNAAEIVVQMGVLAPFTIDFDCKPQRFYNGEPPIRFSGDGGEIQNNTGFDALPLLRLHIEAGTTFAKNPHIRFQNKNGDFRVIFSLEGLSSAEWVELDIEKQCAVTSTGKGVSLTTDSGGFPSFCSGITSVYDASWANQMEIYPRWWTL